MRVNLLGQVPVLQQTQSQVGACWTLTIDANPWTETGYHQTERREIWTLFIAHYVKTQQPRRYSQKNQEV